MKTVVQRVNYAYVKYENVKEEINKGIVVLLAIGKNDTEEDLQWMAKKIVNLRIFENNQGKMDKSVLDIDGEILIVPEFTLYGDCRKGNRPDFTFSEKPELAEVLFDKFVSEVKKYTSKVKTGKFRSYMEVNIINDGPVTLILESKNENV